MRSIPTDTTVNVSVDLVAVNGMTGLALVTPVGGICLAAGWIFLIFTL